jgi:alanyl-tRNA synthetase
MTDRLYYQDSFLYKFDAEIREVLETPRPAIILDRTAFYPTSGGQIHDTGWLILSNPTASQPNDAARFRVTEVADTEDGRIVHYLEPPLGTPLNAAQPGLPIRGEIAAARRRDHMQQHSAQHVLSAAFMRLFDMPTVSFHMADDYCSIDLNTTALTQRQIESAELLANEIMIENRPVEIRYVTRDEAAQLGLRKLPPAERDPLRLIDVRDFDLTACGGTHVSQTGQIGGILLRKFEKVRQGYRVEFVAGQRAVATARRDFTALTETAALFSANIYDVPQQAHKSLDEVRALRKAFEQSQDELAAAQAASLLAETPATDGRKVIVRVFVDRELNFLKLLAQKLTRQSSPVIALLATTSPQPALVFAQSPGQPNNMGALLKDAAAAHGGRGGGTKDLAQGGFTQIEGIAEILDATAKKLAS